MSESSIVWFSIVGLEKREQGKRVWFLVVNDLRLKSDLHFENNQKNGIMVGKDSAESFRTFRIRGWIRPIIKINEVSEEKWVISV